MPRPQKPEVNSGGKLIRDHQFQPRDPERSYWSACEICGMYLAAHASSSVSTQPVASRAVPEAPVEEPRSPICTCPFPDDLDPQCPLHGMNGNLTDDEKQEVKNGASD